jgi:hypothetical protein
LAQEEKASTTSARYEDERLFVRMQQIESFDKNGETKGKKKASHPGKYIGVHARPISQTNQKWIKPPSA